MDTSTRLSQWVDGNVGDIAHILAADDEALAAILQECAASEQPGSTEDLATARLQEASLKVARLIGAGPQFTGRIGRLLEAYGYTGVLAGDD